MKSEFKFYLDCSVKMLIDKERIESFIYNSMVSKAMDD